MSFSSNIAQLELQHIIGYNGSVKQGIHFINDRTLLFPSGKVCALHNIDLKVQKFLNCGEIYEMTAIVLSISKRFLAIADKNPKQPAVVVYDLQTLKTKKKLTSPANLVSDKYICLAFSSDSKMLVGQTNKPDWAIVIWNWEKKQMICSLVQNLPVECEPFQISFHLHDLNQICCIGKGMFRIYRIFEDTVRLHIQAKQEHLRNYLCHSWLKTNKLAIGTEQGKVLICDGTTIKEEIVINPDDQDLIDEQSKVLSRQNQNKESQVSPSEIEPVHCIISTKNGFACVWGNEKVFIYKLTDGVYKAARMITLPELSQEELIIRSKQTDNPEKITCLQLNLTEQLIVAGTNYNQLYCCPMIEADDRKDLKTRFKFLIYPFSPTEIRRFDIAVWKSLIAACSRETVFLWNYQSCACELKKVFYEEIGCVAIHPLGLFLIVGFTNRFDVYTIRLEDLSVIKQFVTTNACNQCAFSQGGHMFAIAEGNLIVIYSVLTFEKFIDLRGHNGKVTSIAWCKDDRILFSCGEDGALYEWNVFNGVRENENVWKKCSYLSVTAHPSGGTGYVIGNDQTIKKITNSVMIHSVDTKDQLTDLILSGRNNVLIAGTEKGYIRLLRCPLTENVRWDEYISHNSKITQVMLTSDDLWLITSSEEGSLFIWKISDRDGKVMTEQQFFLAGDVIMKIDDLKLKIESIAHLERQLSDVHRTNEYQIYNKEIYYKKKREEQADKFKEEIEELTFKLESLKSENTALITKHKDNIGDLRIKHLAEMKDKDQNFREKLKREYNSYEKLKKSKELMQEDYESKIHQLKIDHQQQLSALKISYENHLQENRDKLRAVISDHENTKQQMEEMRTLIENDADEEIMNIRNKYTEMHKKQKDQNNNLKGEINMMKGKISVLKNEIQKSQKQIEKKNEEDEKLKGHIKNLGHTIENLRRIIREREETILEKEKCAHDLRKRNQQLEKLNFILNYNAQENENKLTPIQEENNRLRNQNRDMEEKLARFQQGNKNLRCLLKSVRSQMRGIENERMKEQNKAQLVQVKLIRYRQDLSKLVTNIQNPMKLKMGVISLFRQHVEKPETVHIGEETNKVNEYERHIEHLEDTLSGLKEKMAKELATQHRNYERLVQEHSDMIQEINNIRRELLTARSNMRRLEFAFGHSTGETIDIIDIKEKIERVLKIEKNQKKKLNDILNRDKIIVLQAQKLHRLHAHVSACTTKIPRHKCFSSVLLPPIKTENHVILKFPEFTIQGEEVQEEMEIQSEAELISKILPKAFMKWNDEYLNIEESFIDFENIKKESQTAISMHEDEMHDILKESDKDNESDISKSDNQHDYNPKQTEEKFSKRSLNESFPDAIKENNVEAKNADSLISAISDLNESDITI